MCVCPSPQLSRGMCCRRRPPCCCGKSNCPVPMCVNSLIPVCVCVCDYLCVTVCLPPQAPVLPPQFPRLVAVVRVGCGQPPQPPHPPVAPLRYLCSPGVPRCSLRLPRRCVEVLRGRWRHPNEADSAGVRTTRRGRVGDRVGCRLQHRVRTGGSCGAGAGRGCVCMRVCVCVCVPLFACV